MIKVRAIKVSDAVEGQGLVSFSRRYIEHDGLALRQYRSVTLEADYPGNAMYRESQDNGRTYGEWKIREKSSYSTMYGEDELLKDEGRRVWNPVHQHYVATLFTRFFFGDHESAYSRHWRGENVIFDHQYIRAYRKGEEDPFLEQMMRYEEGDDFDPENPRNMDHLLKNIGFINNPIVLKCGDIVVPVGATVRTGCRMAGLDVDKIFPSMPDLHRCVLVARGKYNKDAERYEFTYSNPVILGDLRSSRGIDEPIITELESGRLLLVMRGSNCQMKSWRTRIEDGTPSFKWYAYSDDGGATFTEAEPWHFDDCEVVYSGATISEFIRSTKNGKLYWIGNISDHTASDNWPRFPLQIVEVDERYGTLIKDSLTVIDTRREGETEKVQLSNFDVMEDRETLNIWVSLEKFGQYDASKYFFGEGWNYEIDVDAGEE